MLYSRFQRQVHSLPNEIQQQIISYTYCPKPRELLADIRNYFESFNILYDYVEHLEFIGRHYFITPEDEVHNEMLNYIFYNLYDGHMETIGNLFWKRSIIYSQISNRNPLLSVNQICHHLLEKLYLFPIDSQIRILWGLLVPDERSEFLQLYSTEYLLEEDTDEEDDEEEEEDFDF